LTLFSVMRRPRWIGMLLLALAVAAIFGGLSQWQLSRAVSNGEVDDQRATETARPLLDLAQPQEPLTGDQVGQVVSTTGRFVADGYSVLADRVDDGRRGYWVVGQFAVDYPADSYVAVALGWTADETTALDTAQALSAAPTEAVAVEGRYMQPEDPTADSERTSDGSRPLESAMSVGALINSWPQFDAGAKAYGGYIVSASAPSGLDVISSPAPDRSVQLNWLNIFYAAEWVVFAGFAVFLWYRLVRDAWQREREEAEEAEEAAAGTTADGTRR
jgi:surfeit locus 1 family protein